jgi:mannose-6-phosphate isomerase-like protein (cupin superfamily)
MAADDWKVYRLPDLLEKSDGMTTPWIYRLPAGATDMQGPHDEDEVYFVVSGRARLRVGGREERVEPGSILYVRATSEHSFFEIEEDITLLVFFASGGPG